MNWVFEHQYLQKFSLQINKYEHFNSFEVVGRGNFKWMEI